MADDPAEGTSEAVGLGEGHVSLGVNQFFHGSDGDGGVAGDLGGHLLGGGEELVLRDEAGDDAPLEGFFHAQATAEVEHLVGVGLRDGARQAHRPAREREEAERDLGQAEAGAGVLGPDAQVADQGDLETAAEGVAIDRGDQRLLGVELVEAVAGVGREMTSGSGGGAG